MKKSLSIFLSFVMLITCLCLSGSGAFAYVKEEAPAVSVGETFAVKAPVTKLGNDFDVTTADIYYAKFTPDTTGYYEFVFDTKFTGTGNEGLATGIYCYSSNEFVGYAFCADVPEEYREMILEYLSYSDNPSVSAKLKAGEAYALVIINGTKKEFKSNVTLNGHAHAYKTFTKKSHVDAESMSNNTDGEKYTGCTLNNCPYHKTKASYYAVKSVKLSKKKYTYSGKAKKPAVTVKDRKGNKLKKGTDYTVTYSKNKAIGTAKVTVKFKGNYEGKVTRTFKINPKGTSLSKVSARKKGFFVKWKKQTKKTTGYQIQYSTSKKFTEKTTKTVKVKNNKTTTKTVSNLKGKKKYYVRIRTYKTVSGKKYYSEWSEVKKVTTRK